MSHQDLPPERRTQRREPTDAVRPGLGPRRVPVRRRREPEPRMPRGPGRRPGALRRYAPAAAAGVVAAVVVFVGLYFLVLRGDGPPEDRAVAAPPTASEEAPAEPTATPPPAAVTAADPDEAMALFVQQALGGPYAGPCPAAGGSGFCSEEMFRVEDLVTFSIAPVGEGVIGEAVVSLGDDGSWSVNFVKAPPPGASPAVGSRAVVYQAGGCLNFRSSPGLSAEVVTCQPDGTTAAVVEGPVDADGHAWWRLEGLGWGSGQYLAPAAE